ncbi:unnamed protein product [[Candida] boidinii]|nr:unnamed protein product [[Candida] boidinii]
MNKIPVNQRQPIDLDLPLKNLYDNILKLKPKSEKNIADEKLNLEKYQEMYSKLFAISRLYDDVLQSRLQRLSLSNDPNHYAQQPKQQPQQQQMIQQAYQQYYQQPYVDHNNQRYGQAVNSNSIPQSPQAVNNVAIPSPQPQQYQPQQQQHAQPQSTHSSFSLPTYLPPPTDPQAFQAPNSNQQTAYAPSSPSVMAYNPSAMPNAIALGSIDPQATGTPTNDISQPAPTPTTAPAPAPAPTVSQPNIPAHTDAQIHEHQQTYAQPPSTQSQGVTQYAYSPAPPAYSAGISDRSPAPVPVQPHHIAQPGGPAVPTPTGEPAGIPPTTATTPTATGAAVPAPIIPTTTQQYEVPQPVPVARPEPPAQKVIDLIDL